MSLNDPSFIRPEEFWQQVELAAGQTVAHLGCGAGYYIVPAAQLVGAGGQVIGIDIRSDMLAEVEGRSTRAGVAAWVRTLRANLETGGTTLPDHQLDVVLIANVLHQADPAKLLPEAARIVRPGGRVVVLEWAPRETALGPPAAQCVPKEAVVRIATTAGLRVERSWQPSPYHYALIFRLA